MTFAATLLSDLTLCAFGVILNSYNVHNGSRRESNRGKGRQ
jgi:hypothetical protein